MAGIGREIAAKPDLRSGLRIAMDNALEKYNQPGIGVDPAAAQQPGSIGDYVTRKITGTPGAGLMETLGIPSSPGAAVRDLLGIAEPPPPPVESKPAGTGASVAMAAAPSSAPASQGVGAPKAPVFTGKPSAGNTSDYEFQQAQGVGAGSPYYDRTQDKDNNVTLTPTGVTTPPGTAPARDYNKEIDDLVESIAGGKFTGRSTQVLNSIVQLKQAQLGVVGHQMTAEATKAAHAETAKDRDELARERLAEQTRANKEREANTAAQLKMAEQAGQDTRELRAQADFEKQLNVYGLDKNTGEYNPNLALFRMAKEQKPIPAAYAAAVERVSAPARAHIAKLRAAGKNVTPEDEATIMSNYELKLSAPQK